MNAFPLLAFMPKTERCPVGVTRQSTEVVSSSRLLQFQRQSNQAELFLCFTPTFHVIQSSCSTGAAVKVLSEVSGARKAAVLVSRPLTYHVHSIGNGFCVQVIKN